MGRPDTPETRLVPLDGERGILYTGRRRVPLDGKAPLGEKLVRANEVEWDEGRIVPLSAEDREQLTLLRRPAVAAPPPAERTEDPWLRQTRVQEEELLATLGSINRLLTEKGDEIDARAREELARRKREEEADLRALRVTRYGIPTEIAANLRKAQQDRPATEAVRAWMESEATGLLLYGASQAGKSHAAARWVISKPNGLFLQGPELEMAVRPDGDGQGAALLRRAREAQHLVLDELASKIGPAALEQADTLICGCFDRRRKIIITTNAPSRQDFFALFGDGNRNRVEARFRQSGKVVEVAEWQQLSLLGGVR